MKKIGILNQDISEVIAGLGHFDTIVVCDAGLPIPLGVRRIDLALRPGLPGFLESLKTIAVELEVESWVMAQEIREESPTFWMGARGVPGHEGRFYPPQRVQGAVQECEGDHPHRRIYALFQRDPDGRRRVLDEVLGVCEFSLVPR